ncbi:PepSY domain-containing protein [Paludifilum halophilum]|uniref:PepSY domain-containing protein n=1 Tax=Paludifilum halophilum TaxID=1642702 RepID=A0A235B1E4_9BACL|nr:PepSY domain-containing protein [Paludifilum halophilum]OYD06094.1 hypothetical protein CHM34_18150 [Paludifilum halophilum]
MRKKKTWLAVMAAAVIIVAAGIGVHPMYASGNEKEIATEKAVQIAQDRYPGEVTEVELDDDEGRAVYDMDLETEKGTYDLKMDAVNGDILSIKQEDVGDDGTKENRVTKQATKTKIGMKEAKQIALKKVNGNVNEMELDYEDGKLIYDISIDTKEQEAEVEIDAETGKIVYLSIEKDDDND